MIYLDITTSQKYCGLNPVGIVRCEIECLRYSLEHEELPVAFCCYSREEGKFKIIDRFSAAKILAQIGSPRASQAAAQAASAPPANNSIATLNSSQPVEPPLPLFKRFKKSVRNNGRLFLENTYGLEKAARLKQAIIHLINLSKIGMEDTRGLLKEMVKPSRQNQPRSSAQPDGASKNTADQSSQAEKKIQFPFGPGDILISLGLSWDYLNFEDLYNAKREYGFKIALFVYDVIPIMFREFSNGANELFGHHMLDQIWASDIIFCISDNTLLDLQKFIEENGIPQRMLTRIRLGSFFMPATLDQRPNKFKPLTPGKFALHVSTMEPRKNHDLLFNVWRAFYQEECNELIQLVFVGSPGWQTEDLRRKIGLHRGLFPKYIFWGSDINDEELDWLYKNCRFTLYPSFYEGWGLPVAESLERGKFCISSNTSSLPEVCQDFAEQLHPMDFFGWKNAIYKYMTDDQALQEKEAYIQRAYKPTSWDESYQEFFAELLEFSQTATNELEVK